MMAYAEPSCFIGIIFGTDGHIADGTRENAIPLEEGEYYICDLIGLEVIDDNDNHIGKIYDVIQTGANDVYEIEADNGEHYLFPVIDECILKIDIEAGYVVAHIMKGLMD